MSTEAKVDALPRCDFCAAEASFDFRTRLGPWAYGCAAHYDEHRLHPDLGTGKGQRLVLRAR